MCTSEQYDREPGDSRELFEVPDPAELMRIWSANSVVAVPTEQPGSDFETAFRVGLGLALALLDDSDPSGRQVLARLEVAAARWAREKIPLEIIQHALHEGVKSGLGLRDPAQQKPAAAADGVDGCFVVDVLDTLTAAVSRAYVAQVRSGQEQA
ncbi:hypothetical protein [Nocardia jinanensis]|uniref:RsbT co-antagonist protein RsbRD N-terminal domain-containing protein n=1 Tax=Nocardia jinanensis TaxID=382504 RepID=A0A917RCH6_9NOCA|nr:hypothetical protein [Nocardia jinanensis]GGL01165.1 hypothetical protein GCM10011588_14830 [Nocardia jinanensis]